MAIAPRPGLATNPVSIRIKGIPSLQWAFLQLGLQMSDKEAQEELEEALVDAAQPIVVDARGRVRKRSGRTALTIHASRYLAPTQFMTPFTAEGFAHAFIGTTTRSLGVIIEFGTGPRVWRGSRKRPVAPKSTGAMPAFPFLRPAWDAGWRRLLENYSMYVGYRLESRAAKLGILQKRKMEAEP